VGAPIGNKNAAGSHRGRGGRVIAKPKIKIKSMNKPKKASKPRSKGNDFLAETKRLVGQTGSRINWKKITSAQATRAMKGSHGMSKAVWDKLHAIEKSRRR